MFEGSVGISFEFRDFSGVIKCQHYLHFHHKPSFSEASIKRIGVEFGLAGV